MIQLSQAQTLLAHAIELAEGLGRSISVSIIDANGHEILSARMPGASWFTLDVARDKARTAVAFQRSTTELEALWEAHPALVPHIAQQLPFTPTTLAGGVPLTGEHRVGAVGIAGALPELDLEIAEQVAAFHTGVTA